MCIFECDAFFCRESSRQATPVPFDAESDHGSRISVTPLPSVKNSPRSSPLPTPDRLSPDPLFDRGSVTLPKIEAAIVFPKIEQVRTLDRVELRTLGDDTAR